MEQRAVDPATEIARFRERVDALFVDIARWISADASLSLRTRPASVDDVFGHYEAHQLDICLPSGALVRFIPLSAVVIAAKGRIDVKGPFASSALVYFDAAPVFMTSITAEDGRVISETTTAIVRGFESPGWYWLADPRSKGARFFNRDALAALLREVSDYDLTYA